MQTSRGSFRASIGLLSAALALAVPAAISAPVGAAQPAPATWTTGMVRVAALSAGRFVNSVGINVQFNQADSPYTDVAAIRAAILRLGVRHIRQGIGPVVNASMQRALKEMHAAGIGIMATLGSSGVPPGHKPWPVGPTISSLVSTGLAGDLDLIDGPNEWNLSGDPHWVADLRGYQKALYQAVRANKAFAHVKVLEPALGLFYDFRQLGSLAGYADYSNVHSYPNGGPPDNSILTGRQLPGARSVSGGRPVFSTETGYENAMQDHSTGTKPATPAVAGIYDPVLLAVYARLGLTGTYVYELVDQAPDPKGTDHFDNFGLLNYDMSPKPGYVALARMLNLLADYAHLDWQPGRLSYQLTAAASAGVQQLLLERSDGTFYLLLWRNLSLPATSQDPLRGVHTAPVTVSFPGRAAVTDYRPSLSAKGTTITHGSDSVTVPVGADLTILAIRPGG